MEPVLPHGSTVGVDQGCTTVTDGKMYALNHGGQLRVKTLYRLPGGGIRMRSYNREEHPDEEYSATELIKNEIIVIGKVFWYSVLL
jgi:phage repressor protein C with HTH and peptisase S24 domain